MNKGDMKLFVPVLTPFLFAAAYYPINRFLVVRILGCGCRQGFNANVFNAILFTAMAFVASRWAFRWSEGQRGEVRAAYVTLAIIGIIFSSWFLLLQQEWR